MDIRGIDQLVDNALEALHGGDGVRALAILDQIAAAYPNSASVHWLRSKALLDADNAIEAMEEARRATKLEADSPDAHFVLACAAWQLDEVNLAQRSFEKSLKLAEKDGDILITYARFMAEERSPHRAQKVAQEAVNLEPCCATAWAALGVCQIGMRRFKDAEESCRRALELDPNDLYSQSVMAKLLLEKGDLSRADALTSLIEDHPAAEQFVFKMRAALRRRRAGTLPLEYEEVPELKRQWHDSPKFLQSVQVAMVIAIAVMMYLLLPGYWAAFVLIPVLAAIFSAYRLVFE